jgi:hypothetical protein
VNFHAQLIEHDPENHQYGDCLRVCLASLLDLPPLEVPHFFHDGCDGATGWERANRFLAPLGLRMINIAFSEDPGAVLRSMGAVNRDAVYLMGVGSPRANHTIIARGGAVIHDPGGYAEDVYTRCDDGYTWADFLCLREVAWGQPYVKV